MAPRCTFRGSRQKGRHDDGYVSTGAPVGRPRIHRDINDRKRAYRQRAREISLSQIAVIDFETDPFDHLQPDVRIEPFVACLHRADAEDVIIWEDDVTTFFDRVVSAIEALPDHYTVYAHNGGKFDYLLMIHRLRGDVMFKGRGIMCATIGNHELRDSFHILPDKLASMQKQKFDYMKLRRAVRHRYRDEIISYVRSDCRYLHEMITEFVRDNGLKLSIGQAAISKLRKHYHVKRITEWTDEQLRPYYFGGRVECLQGKGRFTGRYKLYDVNSMYPYVMSTMRHPTGNNYMPRRGEPTQYTAFINLNCNNSGAFLARNSDGGCTGGEAHGNFLVTRHEYEVALRHHLISDVDIHFCIDCEEFTTFEKFIVPMYERREYLKAEMKRYTEGSPEWWQLKKYDTLQKFYLNNSYGKFAQNPRRYHETYITEAGARPPKTATDAGDWGDLPRNECNGYALWERPSLPWRFFNVGTGASITGAARAVLLDAIVRSDDPVYCDTDSLICRALDMDIHPTRLGAWDIEAEFSDVLIAGKKMYAARLADQPNEYKIRCKGAALETGFDGWRQLERILDDEILEIISKAPTLTKTGRQHYLRREIRATASTQKSVLATPKRQRITR